MFKYGHKIGDKSGKDQIFVIDAEHVNKESDLNRYEMASRYLNRIEAYPGSWKEIDPQMKVKAYLERFAVLENNDRAMNVFKKGGIDLTPANMHLQTQNAGEGIKFHVDPAMLKQLQNAPGFVPVIINIQPMTNLRQFLGIQETPTTTASV